MLIALLMVAWILFLHERPSQFGLIGFFKIAYDCQGLQQLFLWMGTFVSFVTSSALVWLLHCGVVWDKRGRMRARERETGETLLHSLFGACVVLLLVSVNGFYTLYKTNRFVQNFVLSFVRISVLIYDTYAKLLFSLFVYYFFKIYYY